MPVRAHDIALLPREPNYIGSAAKPVHTGPWDFLAEVPLVFFGPGIVEPGESAPQEATLADLAPTIGELIGHRFDTPDGRTLLTGAWSGRRPALVITVIWDGAGWNTLRLHEDRWPFLSRIMEQGVSISKAEIGSTPSNTPPIHTTIGTGVFPRRHGIPAVKMTLADGSYVDPYEGHDAEAVQVPSLADDYDRAVDNAALVGLVATVNWHLGMIGHGSQYGGADRDLVLLMNDQGQPYGNPRYYELAQPVGASLTGEADSLDATDGQRDGRWGDRDLADPATRYASPAYVAYQGEVLRNFITEYGFGRDRVPDLLYTNFKSIDDAGHRWGMSSTETGEVLEATDRQLRSLVEHLDGTVGEGRWLLALTADHGQTPYPEESGGWPITGGELRDDANRALDKSQDDRALITRITSAGAFVDENQLEANDLELIDVARWMADYTVEANLAEGARMPARWRDRATEPLFQAAVVRDGRAVLGCTRDS